MGNRFRAVWRGWGRKICSTPLNRLPIAGDHFSAGGGRQTGHHPQQAGFAGAAGAEQRHPLPAGDRKRQVVEQPTVADMQAQADGQPIQGRLAWMGQKDLLYPWLSVRDNVALGARLRGEKVDRDRVAALLEQVELSSCADARPATLSGGMRQRAALARTLYEDRPIVLMDEPFSALDTLTRTRIQTLAATLLASRVAARV